MHHEGVSDTHPKTMRVCWLHTRVWRALKSSRASIERGCENLDPLGTYVFVRWSCEAIRFVLEPWIVHLKPTFGLGTTRVCTEIV